jgi:hypothetical protein
MKLFPIQKGTKRPALHGWNEKATDNPETLAQWRKEFPEANIGVACGPSGLIVLDVDPQGHEHFLHLDLEHGIPNTYTVSTPRGGYHYYFHGSSRNRVHMLPGIDIRSSGGYVLFPGSWVDGKPYKVLNDAPIAPAPKWLLDMVGKPKEKDAQATEITSVDNLVDARRAADYLSSVKPAIEGQGGDLHTYTVACSVRDLGISKELCLDLMQDLFNPRCQPPWDDRELIAKVNHAYRYAQNDKPGANSVEGVFGNASVWDEQDNSFISIERVGLTYPRREWIVENWIPKGPTASTLFTGEGGTGKSLLALQLAVSVATGTEWLGMPTEQAPVLYLTCEDDKPELDRRMYMIRKENPFLGIDSAPIALMPRAGKESLLCIESSGVANKGKFYSAMEAALEKFKPKDTPGLWILDTVADVYAGNENIRSAVNGFLKTIIGGLALKYNVTPILIAHPPSQSGVAGAAKKNYAGSTAWHNGVRNRLVLSWSDKITETGEKVRTLSHEKANYSGSAAPVLLEWVNGCLVPIGEEVVESVLDNLVCGAISDAAKRGQPLSRMPQSAMFIGKIRTIKDHKGKPISSKLIVASVDSMLQNGVLVERRGQKGDRDGRKNGLFVAEEEEAAEQAPFD